MSKAPIFIVATSAMILLSFGALCYLMTIVNPKPLKSSPDDTRRYSSVDTLYVNDLFLPGDNLDYGLEKVPERYAEIINITEYPITRIMPYVHGASGDRTNKVVPPIIPRINYTKIINCTRHGNESISHFPIKGHRRSIKDDSEPKNQIKNPTSLIVKIVDEDGEQKIEIKVGTKAVNQKKARKYRSSSNKMKNRFLKRQPFDLDNHNNTEDTFVILEVNDTIVLNIIGDSVMLSGANKIDTVNTEDEYHIDKVMDNTTEKFNNDLQYVNVDVNKILSEKEKLETNMLDLFKINNTDLNVLNSMNESENLLGNPKNGTKRILNQVDDKNFKSVERGASDVKNNNSVVDLLILEDSLRDALINENDPFVLNENTFNSTE